MEAGFTKADSANLPNIDVVMVARFFASNSNYNAAEFRNVKTYVVQYHDCAASQGGCKHAVALLMWFHRRSEEPSCTSFS
ncbi:hypothetical protein K1T71_011177 [Dendrolimus kikuchii]|uniref:Uncharacterized protein n=1 Tax=Dendrolimus kikuchii TaxID=765133 RepID=A0ACC1CNH8_9NEOP|nr:hypothetical protein K1T71_011177 [Dendrolimus kikuchii]